MIIRPKINGKAISPKITITAAVGPVMGAAGGLHVDDSIVYLGGSLTKDTVIDNPNTYQFTISGAKFIGDGSGLTGISGGGGNYVPATSSPSRIYGTTPSGDQTYYVFNDAYAESESFAKRDINGNVFVADPQQPGHATTKGYVDNQVQNATAGGYLSARLDDIFVVGDGNDNPTVISDLSVPLEQGERLWWVLYELLIGSVGTNPNTNVQIVFPPNAAPGLAIKGHATIQGDATAHPVDFGTPIIFPIVEAAKLVTIALRVEGFPEGGNWGSLQIAAAGSVPSDPPLQVYQGSRVTYRMYYGVA